MKFNINQQDLQQALNYCQGVIEKRNTLPILSKNGIERLAVENVWLKMYDEYKIPLQIFRLSGIYSNKNNVLERIKSGNGSIIRKKKSIFFTSTCGRHCKLIIYIP